MRISSVFNPRVRAAFCVVVLCFAEFLMSETRVSSALMAFRFFVSAPLRRVSKDFRFCANVATVVRFAAELAVDVLALRAVFFVGVFADFIYRSNTTALWQASFREHL